MRIQARSSFRTLALALAVLAAPLAVLAARAQDDEDAPRNRKKDPDALPDEPLPRARALLERGRHDEAQALAFALVEKDPKAKAPRALLVSLYLKTGRDEAESAARKLLELDRSVPEHHLLLGRVLEEKGDLDGADSAYETAVALAKDGEGFEQKVRLAALRAERGKKKEACALLSKVLDEYGARDDLAVSEFVWAARACRLADLQPEVKKQYSRKMYEYSQEMLEQALKKDPKDVGALVESGEIYLEKGDFPFASDEFKRAVERDPNSPEVRIGLARALLAAYYKGSARFGEVEDQLKKALAVDPTCPAAHATLAYMAVTDGDPDRALERCAQALGARPWDVTLHAAKAAALLFKGDDAGFAQEEKAFLEKRPTCARFYNEIAGLVSSKFRYAEARDLARKALALDPDYHPARGTLGLNLLRTGDEAEGKKELDLANKADPYDVITLNTVRLMATLEKDYTTLESEHFTIRLHKKEAAGSSDYVISLLEEAREKLTKKYGVELKRKTLVELFPRVEDFSARSIGLPFIPALGVCFGDVMTVISANEKKVFGKHSWGRTSWHEFTHVCTLNKTKNRIPRWLTEGLSVYEESRGRPSWVREYDVPILTVRARGLILPLLKFDEAFTKPRYADQVMMAYYQGGLACEFMDQRFGFAKILALLDEYAKGKVTREAVPAALGLPCEDFDREFASFLESRYAGIAYLPPPSSEEKDALLDRIAEAPWDVGARGALARAYALTGKIADAEAQAGATLEGVRGLRLPSSFFALGEPEAGLPGSELRAGTRAAWLRTAAGDANLALGMVAASRGRGAEALRRFQQAIDLGTRDPVEARRVRANIFRAEKRWDEAIREYETLLSLVPPMADLHRVVSACYAAKGDAEKALEHQDRVCSLDSDDMKTRLEVAAQYRKKERWADLARILDDAPLIDPFVPDAHFLLGEGLRHSGKSERALLEYDSALKNNLKNVPDAEAGAAACLLAKGDLDGALARAQRALAVDPDLELAKKVVEEVGKAKKPK
ncbi:tetratricopeptide repeat protein [bacterium]|nr:tetratricopeptide repeat protein [bacterium]